MLGVIGVSLLNMDEHLGWYVDDFMYIFQRLF